MPIAFVDYLHADELFIGVCEEGLALLLGLLDRTSSTSARPRRASIVSPTR